MCRGGGLEFRHCCSLRKHHTSDKIGKRHTSDKIGKRHTSDKIVVLRNCCVIHIICLFVHRSRIANDEYLFHHRLYSTNGSQIFHHFKLYLLKNCFMLDDLDILDRCQT